MERFFATLGPAQAAALTHVSADGADWIGDVVADHPPHALRCLDAFHAVGWVTDALDAGRAKVPAMATVARKIRRHLAELHNTLDSGLSNARIEATNTHLRVLTRRVYGYASPNALIAVADLTRGGLCPRLPGR